MGDNLNTWEVDVDHAVTNSVGDTGADLLTQAALDQVRAQSTFHDSRIASNNQLQKKLAARVNDRRDSFNTPLSPGEHVMNFAQRNMAMANMTVDREKEHAALSLSRKLRRRGSQHL